MKYVICILFFPARLCEDGVAVSGTKSGSLHLSQTFGVPVKVSLQNLRYVQQPFLRDGFPLFPLQYSYV